MLHILAVDDEIPALEELAYLLRRDPRVSGVQTANGGSEALLALDRALGAGRPLDAVFLDIGMPGLDGLALARVVSRFARPPRVVFVTAHDDFAVEAFTLRAADYVLKPVHPRRLAEAVRRVAEEVGGGDGAGHPGRSARGDGTRSGADDTAGTAPGGGPPSRGASGGSLCGPAEPAGPTGAGRPTGGGNATGAGGVTGAGGPDVAPDEVIPVELAGVTRFVQRSEVLYAEAQGDYARLHTASGSHLVRTPLAALEERWSAAGFVRIHRSHLVALRHVRELRIEAGRTFVRLGDELLPVSRRHTRQVRDVLVRQHTQAHPGAQEHTDPQAHPGARTHTGGGRPHTGPRTHPGSPDRPGAAGS